MEALITRRLEVRPYSEPDYDEWKSFLTEGMKDSSLLYFRKLLKEISVQREKDRIYKYAAFSLEDRRIVGEVDFFIICREHYQVANMGYSIHPRLWRKGYGKELALAGIRLAFEELGVQRVEAAMEPENLASEGVARGIGMTYEGLRHGYIKMAEGWRDMKVYSAVKDRFHF
jgi:RimJ/RimL family protein N-acetyltransferase